MSGERKRRSVVAAVAAIIALAAGCVDDDGVVRPPAADPAMDDDRDGAVALGLVEVTITGLGTDEPRASVRSLPSGAAPLSLDPPGNDDGSGDGTIQFERAATGSFTSGERGADGVRYLHATYRVRNAQEDGTPYDVPRENLTFVAVDTDGTIGSTAVSSLERFDGSEAATSIAAEMVPTGQVHRTPSDSIRSSGPDVLQLFTETEASELLAEAPSDVSDVFPYGFVARNADDPTSRAMPADPAAGEFDGLVTFAFRVPLEADSDEDPFTVSAVFLAVDDQVTRVTQSPQEQSPEAQSRFEERVTELGATRATILSTGEYTGLAPEHVLCEVRVAGSAASPTSVLDDVCLVPDGVVMVDASATGAADGTSWEDAYTDLQDALAAASSGDEIWVAEGTYHPTDGTDRTATFQLQSGVTIVGGYPAAGGLTRDPDANPTILSGDIGTAGDPADNALHVVTGNGADATAVLDGFTVRDGYADGGSFDDQSGAGLFNENGSPTIRNAIFRDNTADYGGGAVHNDDGGEPTFVNVVFRDNDVASDGGAVRSGDGNPVFVNAVFHGNTAGDEGGAIKLEESEGTLVNVTITGNSANYGGGVDSYIGGPDITNTIISGNSPTDFTAYVDPGEPSEPTFTNSLVVGSGGSGAGWDDDFGIDGGGNIDADPLFVGAADFRLQAGSPAIDAGDDAAIQARGVTTDVESGVRIADGDGDGTATVDMGAYERP